MKNHVNAGLTMDFTATVAVVSGQAVLVGDLLGVAVADIAVGDTGTLSLEGAYSLPKAAVSISQGEQLYWDGTNEVLTNVADENTACGKALAPAESDADGVDVKINV